MSLFERHDNTEENEVPRGLSLEFFVVEAILVLGTSIGTSIEAPTFGEHVGNVSDFRHSGWDRGLYEADCSLLFYAVWVVACAVVMIYHAFKRSRDATISANTTSKNLEMIKLLSQTQPSYEFVIYQNDVFEDLHLTVQRCLSREDQTMGDLAYGMRQVLDSITSLCCLYGVNGEHVYGATVLGFVDLDFIKKNRLDESIREELRFVEKNKDNTLRHELSSFKGFLKLMPELSPLKQDPEDWRDDIQPLTLPIPRERSRKKIDGSDVEYTLPGGPWAFAYEQYSVLVDTLDIATWKKDGHHLDPLVVDDLIAYFERRKDRFRSFISIPVFDPSSPASGEEARCLGVVNLESQVPSFFKGRGMSPAEDEVSAMRIEQFETSISPLIKLFSRLFVVYIQDHWDGSVPTKPEGDAHDDPKKEA